MSPLTHDLNLPCPRLLFLLKSSPHQGARSRALPFLTATKPAPLSPRILHLARLRIIALRLAQPMFSAAAIQEVKADSACVLVWRPDLLLRTWPRHMRVKGRLALSFSCAVGLRRVTLARSFARIRCHLLVRPTPRSLLPVLRVQCVPVAHGPVALTLDRSLAEGPWKGPCR